MPSPFGRAALPITACAAALVAIILLVLSYASPYWSNDANFFYGLWRNGGCREEGSCWRYNYYHMVEPWLHAVRAMETIAIITLSLPVVTIPVYMYVSHGLYYRTVNIISAGLCLASAIFIIIGVIVYGAFASAIEGRELAWCFVVCLISGIISILAFLLFLVSAILKRPLKPVYLNQSYAAPSVMIEPSTPTIYTVEKDQSAADNMVFVE